MLKNRISLIKLNSDMRYVDSEEMEENIKFRNEITKEYQRLLYVELPSLINRIVNTRALPIPVIPELIQISVDEIEKITTEECNHIIEKYRDYIGKPLDEETSNDLRD